METKIAYSPEMAEGAHVYMEEQIMAELELQDAGWLAQKLGLTGPQGRRQVYLMVRLGQIPCVRLGRTIRFHPQTIETWVLSGGTGYTPPSERAAKATAKK